MSKPYSYDEACALWKQIVDDLEILAGDAVGPGDVSWQDVAGTLTVNLRVLATSLDEARAGNVKDGSVVFRLKSERHLTWLFL